QTFAERGLIDLDDPDPGCLQIQHFIANGQGQLPGLYLRTDVFPREGPHQHGYRAGEHALHHPSGLALGIAYPVHRHGPGTVQVADNDGRLDAARAVALYPAEAGEGVALQLFCKILDHIVALGLPVYQDIQSQLFLEADGVAYLAAHGFGVLGGAEPALPECQASLADGRRLREGTYGGGREGRQLQMGTLAPDPFGERRGALTVSAAHGGQALLHLRSVDTERGCTAGASGLRVAWARMATSSHFCTAKASQLLSSSSSWSSRVRSTGLCSSEQDGATQSRSPNRSWAW